MYFLVSVIYILLGIILLNSPVITLVAASLYFGWVILIIGIGTIFSSFKATEHSTKSLIITFGVLLSMLGMVLLFGNFINNTLFMSYLLIFWILSESIIQITLIFNSQNSKKWIAVFLNSLIVIYSIFLLFNPILAEYLLVFYISFGFFVTGVTRLFQGLNSK